MKKLLMLLLAILCRSWLSAQSERSLLWEISGNGLSQPSYVLGTIHMLCPQDFFWSKEMDTSLKKSKTVCMELDLDDPQTLQKMMQGLQSSGGKSLRESLSEKDYERFRKFAKDSAGIDAAEMSNADPGSLSMTFLSKLLPCASPASYEVKIALDAAAAHKPIEGLESVDEQLALLDKLNADSSAGQLMQLVDSFPAMKAQFARMVSTFRQQDLDGLAAMIDSSPLLGGQTDAFLSDRNRRWIPRMEGYMSKGPVFFAVGAGHLPGKAGVLQLLRKSGYQVRPMR
jgi:uncharacterized protein YbaP (TraB family)